MAAKSGGLFPVEPKEITIPTFAPPVAANKTISIPNNSPFYYAAIQCIWIFWQVELEILDAYLAPLGMAAVPFGPPGSPPKFGCASINFFNAAALYGAGFPGSPGVAGFNETEVNILAYPTAVEATVPKNFTIEQFICGADQTKRIGAYRVWVACDDAVAVAAGQQIFFENKFLTPYQYSVPALNNPGVTAYDWTCYDDLSAKTFIYQGHVDLSGLTSIQSNPTEWIDLSYVTTEARVAASRRNFFGTPDTYLAQSGLSKAVTMKYGTSKHDMRRDMERLIGGREPVAIQVLRSPTVIAEARPYWADV